MKIEKKKWKKGKLFSFSLIFPLFPSLSLQLTHSNSSLNTKREVNDYEHIKTGGLRNVQTLRGGFDKRERIKKKAKKTVIKIKDLHCLWLSCIYVSLMYVWSTLSLCFGLCICSRLNIFPHHYAPSLVPQWLHFTGCHPATTNLIQFSLFPPILQQHPPFIHSVPYITSNVHSLDFLAEKEYASVSLNSFCLCFNQQRL